MGGGCVCVIGIRISVYVQVSVGIGNGAREGVCVHSAHHVGVAACVGLSLLIYGAFCIPWFANACVGKCMCLRANARDSPTYEHRQ